MKRKMLYIVAIFTVLLMLQTGSTVFAARACSINSPIPFFPVTFVNNSGAPVDIRWINYRCGETMYRDDLPDGGTYMVYTYQTHPWMIRDAATQAPLYCFVAWSSTTITITSTYQDFCQLPDPVVGASDGRVNFHHCDDQMVIYSETDAQGQPLLDIYGLTGSNGTHFFSIDSLDVEAFADAAPSANTMLDSFGDIRAYMLTTGELQFNSAPDAEGKECVVVMNGLVPSRVYSYTLR